MFCLCPLPGLCVYLCFLNCFFALFGTDAEKRPPNEAEEYLGYVVGDEKVALKSGYGEL